MHVNARVGETGENGVMPIVIGAKPESSFEDPIGLLTDCHRRIENFLSVLVKVTGEAQGGALTPEQRGALERALQYFREAAPKHTADEEESLFPRLRGLDNADAAKVLHRVEGLESDHVVAVERHAAIDRLGQLWLTDGSLAAEDCAQLSGQLAELSALYRSHIEVEEHEVFPMAARVLNAGDRQAMGGEMAARRGR